MNRFAEHIKLIVALAFLALLSWPMVQHGLRFNDEMELNGAFNDTAPPPFSWNSWFEGSFQDSLKSSIKADVGFRALLTRSHNQLNYSLHRKSNLDGWVQGKEGVLFEKSYIETLSGQDFLGVDSLLSIGRGLEQVNDTLRQLGIDLLVVLAPGKGHFHQNLIPDYFEVDTSKTTNFDLVQQQLALYQIPTINCRSWFDNMKVTSRYPLFPKNGVHWSQYAEFIVMDSIISTLEILTERRLPTLGVNRHEVNDFARFFDQDIEDGMNLLFDIPDDSLAYPGFTIEDSTNGSSPTVLTISDSFWWDMFNLGFSNSIFNEGQFWYYCAAVYPESNEKATTVWDQNYRASIERNDAIVLICTDANLHRFPFGLIKQMRYYYDMPYLP
ncbi:MAG: hypothetical protein P8H59_02310 [Flavobacteriales bacterium]|nr:hypothetical protein [Flavobacteriales bacterium]